MLERYLVKRLPPGSPPRRIVVVTGARQVGKTTLARELYESRFRYLNLDSPGERARLSLVPAEGWHQAVGPAILDEVQKAPLLLEKLKWAYDEGKLDFSVLLGSSRITLLEQVRESLAGRVFLYELWPLTVGELAPHFGGMQPNPPLLAALLNGNEDPITILERLERGIVGAKAGAAQSAMIHLLQWGGLPSLLQYDDNEKLEWLDAYQATYLERDLADLARLRDLEPFSTCHRLASLRTGRILSYSEIARDAGLPVTTVRRYLGYLELSYQTFRLNPWAKNPGVRFIKSPKLIWSDLGVQRILSGQTGGLTGEQYESAVISQLLIHLWTLGIRVTPSYLRTSGGTEVDLILEGQSGILAVEIKNRSRVSSKDAVSIERSRKLLGKACRAGLVVYRGDAVGRITSSVFAVPDWVLFGTSAQSDKG